MSEGSWARLTIGGSVSRRALADALERLVGRRLDECLQDGHVVVEDPDAAWGGFSDLEAWLEDQGIPFDLESGACPGTWPDMLVHFRPGRGRLEFVCDDSHQEPVIPRSALRAALARCHTVRGVRRWLAPKVPDDPAASANRLGARPGRRELSDRRDATTSGAPLARRGPKTSPRPGPERSAQHG